MSRPTFSELAWPMDDESRRQAEDWAAGVSVQVLDWTWRAFDALRANILPGVDLSQPLEQLERDLTAHHFRQIQQLWAQETGGYSLIAPHHEWPEMETRSPAPAKPPAYDIAFVWDANQRVALPIEAKVVPTPGTLAAYLTDTEKFASGTAAPFVGEGAQIAYLLSGTAEAFLSKLAAGLPSLSPMAKFKSRDHHFHKIQRTSAPHLRLHHLVMHC